MKTSCASRVAVLAAVLIAAGGATAGATDAGDTTTDAENYYYGDVVLTDDGSFPETPEIVSNATTGGGEGVTTFAIQPVAQLRGEAVRFAPGGGTRPAAFSVLVFDATGRTLFAASSETGDAIEWNLHDARGPRVAHGLYVYRAFARSADGRVAAAAGKIVVP